MIRSRATFLVLAASVAASGCGSRSDSAGATPSAPASGSLPLSVVATVGSRSIPGESVARVAATQKIDLGRARDLVIRDALFATEAQASGLQVALDVELAVRGAMAHCLLRHLLNSAKEAGPVTDTELRDATQRRWLDVDRPEGFSTVHAVVRLDADSDEAKRGRAMVIAKAIHSAIVALRNRTDDLALPNLLARPKHGEESDSLEIAFRRAAASIVHEGFEVLIQPLPPITADGRVLAPDEQHFDADFTRAAVALERRGDVSPVIVSPFGVHVILLLDRIPASILSKDQRLRILHGEIMAERARAAEQKLLGEMRSRSATAPDADALLALVAVDQ